METFVRKSFDEVPAVLLAFFPPHSKWRRWLNPLPVTLRALAALRMRFSEGDSKLRSQRASCRQTQTRRRFTGTPAARVKFHMRERIKRLERRLFLSTLIEGLEDDIWFWRRTLLCCFSQHRLHMTFFEEISALDHQKANQYKFWRSLSRGLIDWFYWNTVS